MSFTALSYQAEADGQGLVYFFHRIIIHRTHLLAQSALVEGAYLLQQHHAVLAQSAAAGLDRYVGGELGLALPAGYRRGDNGGGVAVAYVVLHNQHRPYPALLAADHRAEIGVIYISSFDVHFVISPAAALYHNALFAFLRAPCWSFVHIVDASSAVYSVLLKSYPGDIILVIDYRFHYYSMIGEGYREQQDKGYSVYRALGAAVRRDEYVRKAVGRPSGVPEGLFPQRDSGCDSFYSSYKE